MRKEIMKAVATKKVVEITRKKVMTGEQSEGEKSILHNIGAITDDICGRIETVTPAKRKEVESAVAEQYMSRMRKRAGSPMTPTWHKRMVSGLIQKLNIRFDAVAPIGWLKASREERTMMLLNKRERTAYLRAKAAGSEITSIDFVSECLRKDMAKVRVKVSA
jgi:hypothetical protein